MYERYGDPDVLELRDVERPIPLDDEVLVEVHAASLNAYDWHMLTADVFLIRLMSGGLFRPKNNTLGADIAGKVVSVGKDVTRFKPGDEVFGTARGGTGGLAEYVCASERGLVSKPSSVSFEEASTASMAAFTALQGLRDEGQVKPGQKVLIHGASGGVGTFAIQIAKSFGAKVTAVCSTRNLEIARSIGADHVIDYTKKDFSQGRDRYDVIFVANGDIPISRYAQALKEQGVCVLVGGGDPSILSILIGSLQGWWISVTQRKRIGSFMAKFSQKDLDLIKGLLGSGKVKPVIDRRYPLDRTSDAFRYLGKGHAKGKVVIIVEHASTCPE